MAKDKKVDETKPVKVDETKPAKADKKAAKRNSLRKTHSNPLLLSLKALMQNAKKLFGQQQRKQLRIQL